MGSTAQKPKRIVNFGKLVNISKYIECGIKLMLQYVHSEFETIITFAKVKIYGPTDQK